MEINKWNGTKSKVYVTITNQILTTFNITLVLLRIIMYSLTMMFWQNQKIYLE